MRRLVSASLSVAFFAFAAPADAKDCGAPAGGRGTAGPTRPDCASTKRSLRDEAEAVQAGKFGNGADFGDVQIRVRGTVRAEAIARSR